MRKNSKIDKQALVECICYLLFAFVKPDEVFDYYEISESDLQEDTDHE